MTEPGGQAVASAAFFLIGCFAAGCAVGIGVNRSPARKRGDEPPINPDLFDILRYELGRIAPENGMLHFVEEHLRRD